MAGGLAARLSAAVLIALALLITVRPATAVAADDLPPPYRMIALLEIDYREHIGRCTGFMIGPHTVATAAHCLYSRDRAERASGVAITPGLDGLTARYQKTYATTFAINQGYIDTGSTSEDYAVITLDDVELGRLTGWFELDDAPDARLQSGTFEYAGYTGEVGKLWQMPRPQPLLDYTSDLLVHSYGGGPGVSGAPVFGALAGGYGVIGLVHGGVEGAEEFSARMTPKVRDFFRAEIARPAAARVQTPFAAAFTEAHAGTQVRLTIARRPPGRALVLQSSVDGVIWTTIGSATTNGLGVAVVPITVTQTMYFRAVTAGVGVGSTLRGTVFSPPGRFATPPRFGPGGLGFAIFMGGSVNDLDAALAGAGASGAWGQTADGAFVLYIVNGGPVNDGFRAVFPQGLASATALTVVAAGGA